MSDIFNNPKGFSPCEYLKQLESLQRVMTHKIMVKHGKGRKATHEQVYAHRRPEDDIIRERLIKSIEHYTELCSNLETTKKT